MINVAGIKNNKAFAKEGTNISLIGSRTPHK